MKNNRRVRRAIAEYFMFLGITVFAVFVAVMIFDAVRERYDGDTAARRHNVRRKSCNVAIVRYRRPTSTQVHRQ